MNLKTTTHTTRNNNYTLQTTTEITISYTKPLQKHHKTNQYTLKIHHNPTREHNHTPLYQANSSTDSTISRSKGHQ